MSGQQPSKGHEDKTREQKLAETEKKFKEHFFCAALGATSLTAGVASIYYTGENPVNFLKDLFSAATEDNIPSVSRCLINAFNFSLVATGLKWTCLNTASCVADRKKYNSLKNG